MLDNDPIKIMSNGETIFNTFFDDKDNTETFIYIKNCKNPTPNNKINFDYEPFIFGPQLIALKSEFDIIYNNNNPQLGIYRYDPYNKEWKFEDNQPYNNGIGAKVKSGGIFSIIKDETPPLIQNLMPQINSTYRHDHFDHIKFQIEDKQSGIANEKDIKVFLNGKELIVEYNSYRKMVFYKIKEPLQVGSHQIKIVAMDNSKNKLSLEGTFYIK